MAKILNNNGISLPLAMILLYDDYDYDPRPNYISATSLLKSTKQIVLGKRMESDDYEVDVTAFTKARLGQAIHAMSETAWKSEKTLRKSLDLLGYPEDSHKKFMVNPLPSENIPDDAIVIYLENRSERQFGEFVIGGKYDMVMKGRVKDIKSTSTYTYTKSTNNHKYALQGSIYKWLNPEIVTDTIMDIEFIFTDWKQGLTNQEGYPEAPVKTIHIPLLSTDEIEEFISNKLSDVLAHMMSVQDDIPPCTKEELWQDESVFQYFSKSENKRASKNFTTHADAYAYLTEKGTGVVREKLGQAKACNYCQVRPICKQAEQLQFDNLL